MSVHGPAKWVKFFEAAGIPSNVAASYAHIFIENRIQTDMLMDLNKECLREMGINPLGDIIAILRHSKSVTEIAAREKVLSIQTKVPIAAVSGNPSSASAVVRMLPKSEHNSNGVLRSDTETTLKPRRVLPEHEGRYKITLPSGTTKRSKEILEKKAMQTDKPKSQKAGIFSRLGSENPVESPKEIQQTCSLVGFPKASQSSVFKRLGGKSESEREVQQSKGILKNSPVKKSVTVAPAAITKRTIIPPHRQKTIVVKKIPAKAATMIADEVEMERMEISEPLKMVSFSSEDEVVEIAPRRLALKSRLKKLNALNGGGRGGGLNLSNKSIKLRLGLTAKDALNRTRKTVTFKSESPKKKIIFVNKLKVDQMKSSQSRKLSVHKRLELNNKKHMANNVLASKLEKVKLDSQEVGGKSVFNRLG